MQITRGTDRPLFGILFPYNTVISNVKNEMPLNKRLLAVLSSMQELFFSVSVVLANDPEINLWKAFFIMSVENIILSDNLMKLILLHTIQGSFTEK